MAARIDDTYAEAFRSLYTEFLVTARDADWAMHAARAATGNAASTILCDCEAGVDRAVEASETPDGRPGVVVQLHVPRFWKDRVERLDRAALVRISQNVLTCPTARCFNLLDTEDYFHTGRKVAYFGNGHQKRIERYGRRMWWVPTLGGEFVLDRRLGYADGLMGGNLWFFGESEDAALNAAMRGAAAVAPVAGTVLCFPGGIAGSGSKPGSDYDFAIASTYEKYCPQLQDAPGVERGLPESVRSVMEIIINGRDLATIVAATRRAVEAAVDSPGLLMISAGNYGGRLGKNFIYLHPDKQPPLD